MGATRREFLWGTLGVAVAGKLAGAARAEHGLGEDSGGDALGNAKGGAEADAAYGSGSFGTWIEDEFGLPAFRYTANQTNDPHAETPVRPGILGAREHIHQVGNDRITALASNYGHVRVRQDEGCPKILNDVDPERSQFGGGLGYLTDGKETLSTYFDGGQAGLAGGGAGFERVFGVGYFRKRVTGRSYDVDQVIWAPFGDDPVLVSQATVTNKTDAAATVRWVEYWGCQPYQLSFRSFIETMGGGESIVQVRREMGRRFESIVALVDGMRGLKDTKRFEGRTAEDEAAWERAKAMLRRTQYGFISPVEESRPGTDFESLEMPQTFLVSLDELATAMDTDTGAFFGAGGAARPSGLNGPAGANPDHFERQSGFLLERKLELRPGEKRTLSFMYGYLPEGFELEALVTKYSDAAAGGLRKSTEEWKRRGMRFDVPAEPWVKRESTWNHYYLRSSQTYDDYFGEHILNQNGFYQYTMGFQGAARDPLQHCLPFLFSDAEIVRSILRYTLKEVRDDGSVPYGIVGHGVVAPLISDKASDLPLWLLWTASEYVLATRDVGFLEERIPARFSATAGRTETVRGLLERCYRHQMDHVGMGEHGIVRMLADDWNDGLLATWAQSAMGEAIEKGESVLNAAMGAWVFDYYARMLRYAGDGSGLSKEATMNAQFYRVAAGAQWNGKWLKRAWLGPKLGWLGDETLWIEPQPWAILGGVTSEEQSRKLVTQIDKLLRQGPLGAAQMSDGPDMRSGGETSIGTLERGAIWPSLNQTLVWALAGMDKEMAWEEWKRNTLARHADAFPNLWYGVWSGNDSYNSTLNRNPGGAADEQYFAGTDFPVLNVHAHACFLYSATKLLGIEFTEAGVKLRPALPVGAYRFDSPLLGLAKTAAGRYEGWYAPSRAGSWTVEIALPEGEAKGFTHAEMNGVRSAVKRLEDGTIVLKGSSSVGKALRWALR